LNGRSLSVARRSRRSRRSRGSRISKISCSINSSFIISHHQDRFEDIHKQEYQARKPSTKTKIFRHGLVIIIEEVEDIDSMENSMTKVEEVKNEE
jgi:uncharacterized membrane protein YgaE (UPF0421/DUF939 family)